MFIDSRSILAQEIEATRVAVGINIDTVSQRPTGKAKASLRTESGDDYAILFGNDYISTLETGISPAQANPNILQLSGSLLFWLTKGSNTFFATKRQAYLWSFSAARNQQSMGSVLYRKLGGSRRNTVYTDEGNNAAKRIADRIATMIVNVKILE